MPAAIDCYLCLLRQSLEAARFATPDESIHRQVVLNGMERVLKENFATPPPVIGRAIHRLIKEVTGNPDPYHAEKIRFDQAMLAQIDPLRKRIADAADPLDMAVRLAIAGNSIDFALGVIKESDVAAAFDQGIARPVNGDIDELRRVIEESKTVFFLTDNAGEIVCDRLLVELLTGTFGKKVTVAVRGKPMINDATMEDAELVGMTEVAPVISNGNDGLGTFLDECSAEFLDHFQNDDLVLCKGLANYETLVENRTPRQPKKIVFLFKAKCPFISRFAGTELGDLVVRIF